MLLYGQFGDFWSNACVSRGIAVGLAANGVKVTIASDHNEYVDLLDDTCEVFRECEVDIGADPEARVAGYVGYPVMGITKLRHHHRKIGFFIAESEVLPASWAWAASACDLVVVPSRWTERAFLSAGVPASKLMVAGHGIHPVYHEGGLAERVGEPPLRFLHVSGARDYLQRKGTPQLIEAFARVFGRQGMRRSVKLVLRTPPSPEIYQLIAATGESELFHVTQDMVDGPFSPNGPLPPKIMRKLLALAGWTAVVQPSRAEAFGLVPVEARALGIPVIATHCSGHVDHAESTDVVVPHGESAPLATNGILGAMAPVVTSGWVMEALVRFMDTMPAVQEAARENAAASRSRWRWDLVMAPVAARIKEMEP